MPNKTRRKKNNNKSYKPCNKDAIKGTSIICRSKTSKNKLYESIYGKGGSGLSRKPRQLFY